VHEKVLAGIFGLRAVAWPPTIEHDNGLLEIVGFIAANFLATS
jgi:hypothetical protein